MYFRSKITFVNIEVSKLKLKHTRGGIVWHIVQMPNYTPGIFSRLLRNSWYTGCPLPQDPILSFSHTFSPKSAHVGGPRPPNGSTTPMGNPGSATDT